MRIQNADAFITFSTLADNGSGVNFSYFSFNDLNLVQLSASILQNAAADNCGPGDLPMNADQRGFSRPVGSACDSGAVEVVRNRLFADGFEGS